MICSQVCIISNCHDILYLHLLYKRFNINVLLIGKPLYVISVTIDFTLSIFILTFNIKIFIRYEIIND